VAKGELVLGFSASGHHSCQPWLHYMHRAIVVPSQAGAARPYPGASATRAEQLAGPEQGSFIIHYATLIPVRSGEVACLVGGTAILTLLVSLTSTAPASMSQAPRVLSAQHLLELLPTRFAPPQAPCASRTPVPGAATCPAAELLPSACKPQHRLRVHGVRSTSAVRRRTREQSRRPKPCPCSFVAKWDTCSSMVMILGPSQVPQVVDENE